MRAFFRSARMKVLTAVLAVLLLGVIVAAAAHTGGTPLSNAVGAVFGPVHQLSSYLSEQIGSFFGAFASSGSYREENTALKEQVAALEEQLVDYENMKTKQAQYEDLLQVEEEHPDFTYATAKVIGRDAADASYSFLINRGKDDGIEKEDPVISGPYLVGKVDEVYETYAKVKTIFDPSIHPSAYELITGDEGYVSGDASLTPDGTCRLSNLKSDTTIAAGGRVLTAGVGGVYPENLIIGTVIEVRNDTRNISLYAVVKPGVEIPSLKNVTVITSFRGQGVSQTGE